MLQAGSRGKYRYLLFGSFALGTSCFFLPGEHQMLGTGEYRNEEKEEVGVRQGMDVF